MAFMVLERLGLGKLLEKTKADQACLHDTGALRGLDLLPGGRRGAYAAVSEAHVPSLDVYGVRFCGAELVTNRAFFLAACGILGCGVLQKCAVKISPRAEKFKNSTAELIFCMLLLCLQRYAHGQQHLQRIYLHEFLTAVRTLQFLMVQLI